MEWKWRDFASIRQKLTNKFKLFLPIAAGNSGQKI